MGRNAVTLYRALHRGAEGAGVAVSWDRVEDVRDLDGAMDAITERGDGWMHRLLEDGRRSVWGIVEGRPVEFKAPSWLSRDDIGLQRGERDWIDALGTLCGAPVPFVVEALCVMDRRNGVDIALHMTLCAWECADVEPPGEPVLRGIDAWRRGDVIAASLRDRVERLRAQLTPYATQGMPPAVIESGRSALSLAESVLADESAEAGAHVFLAVGAARKSYRFTARQTEGPHEIDRLVRERVTPEMLFDVFRSYQPLPF